MKINKLFLIPHAGGMANSYSFLCEYFKDVFQICLIELAGHGGRYNEKLYSDFKEAANDVYMQIKSRLNEGEEYAIMGHSMGHGLLMRCIIYYENEVIDYQYNSFFRAQKHRLIKNSFYKKKVNRNFCKY